MSTRLGDLLPDDGDDSADTLLGRFLDYVAGKGLVLYPAQEEAILELLEGKNVILNTPTGSGKSLVASAMLFAALARGHRAVYTCPIKALVNEKWMALCREFGPEQVGLSTGDATVNRDAPILCCTAEVLANIALREGAGARIDDVVMDEFHWYADRDRGVAWQVPLLTLPYARFLLMSATLGDTSFFEKAVSTLNDRPTARVVVGRPPGAARVRVLRDPARAHAGEARGGRQDARLRRALHPGRCGGQRTGLHQSEGRVPGRRRRRSRRSSAVSPSRARTARRSGSGSGTASACTMPDCCPSTACWSSSSRSAGC